MPHADSGLLVLADDLSGAAEAAVTLGPPVRVLLADTDSAPSAGSPSPAETASAAPSLPHTTDTFGTDVAVDLDCRYLPAEVAARRTEAALTALRGAPPRAALVKIDSLLRGNVKAHLNAALASTEGRVIFAPALPQQGRTVEYGAPLVDGTPLRQTPAWNVEDGTAPAVLADLCPAAPVHLSLGELRSRATTELNDALPASALITADAETMGDLRGLVALADMTGAVLVGSAALARARADLREEAERRGPALSSARGQHPAPGGRRGGEGRSSDGRPAVPRAGSARADETTGQVPTLMVLGTASGRIADQVKHLMAHTSAAVFEIPAAVCVRWTADPEALAVAAARVRRGLQVGDLVVRLTDTGEPVDPRKLPNLLAQLAHTALAGADPVNLVAAGGETARAVLDHLRIRSLDALAEIHSGAVLSKARTGAEHAGRDTAADPAFSGPRPHYVVTRPGGQGEEASLTLIHRALTEAPRSALNSP